MRQVFHPKSVTGQSLRFERHGNKGNSQEKGLALNCYQGQCSEECVTEALWHRGQRGKVGNYSIHCITDLSIICHPTFHTLIHPKELIEDTFCQVWEIKEVALDLKEHAV